MPAYCEFADENWIHNAYDTKQVNQHESGTAILAGLEREAPKIAEADSSAYAHHKKGKAVAPARGRGHGRTQSYSCYSGDFSR
jgi:hypothetical protein